MKKLLCKIFGHKWYWLGALYQGDLNGRWCERCGKEEGKRI